MSETVVGRRADDRNELLIWSKDQPGITAPLNGPRTMEHLKPLLPVLEMSLLDEARAAWDELVPPGSCIASFHSTARLDEDTDRVTVRRRTHGVPCRPRKTMRVSKVVHAVDTHVCGEPGRVIVGGVLDVPGGTMFEKMQYLETKADELRLCLLWRAPCDENAWIGCRSGPRPTWNRKCSNSRTSTMLIGRMRR